MVKIIGVLILLCSLSFSNQQPGPCAQKLAANQLIIQSAVANFGAFNDFMGSLEQEIFEVDYVMDLIGLGLLSKEHLLMFGSHGTAKSAIMRLVGDNILMPDGKPSLYWHTVSEETSEAHVNGVLDPKALWDESMVKLADKNALTNFRIGALNELFDGRPNALRLFLDSLQERMTQLGGFGSKPILEMIMSGTNFYLPEVEEKAGKKAHALLDRFAFMVNVAEEFEEVVSSRRMMRRLRGGISPLYFNQLDAVRGIVPLVEVPTHVIDFLTLLTREWKQITERKEFSSMRQFLEDRKLGRLEVMPLPPYRATRRTSKRTRDRARNVLQTWVAWESLKKGRPLVATADDVQHLYRFFTLNSASTDFLTEYQSKVVIPGEKRQLSTTLDERKDFADTHAEILNKVNSIGELDWEPVDAVLRNPSRTRHETSEVLRVILRTALESNAQTESKTLKLSGESIGHQRSVDEALARLRKILPDTAASEDVLNHFRDAPKDDLEEVAVRITELYANVDDPLGKLIDGQLANMARQLKTLYESSSPEEKIEFEKGEQALTDKFGPRIIRALKKEGIKFSSPPAKEPEQPTAAAKPVAGVTSKGGTTTSPSPPSPAVATATVTASNVEGEVTMVPNLQVWTEAGPIFVWHSGANSLTMGSIHGNKITTLDTKVPVADNTKYSIVTKSAGGFLFVNWGANQALALQYHGKKFSHHTTLRNLESVHTGSGTDQKIYVLLADGSYTSIDFAGGVNGDEFVEDKNSSPDSQADSAFDASNPHGYSERARGFLSPSGVYKIELKANGFRVIDNHNTEFADISGALNPIFMDDSVVGYWMPKGSKYVFRKHKFK